MIDDFERLSKKTDEAIEYLGKTDGEHAAAKAEMDSLKELLKTVHSYEFIDAEGSMDLRRAKAYASESYKEQVEKVRVATEAYHTLHNKRTRAIATIDLYRTLSANQRRGNV